MKFNPENCFAEASPKRGLFIAQSSRFLACCLGNRRFSPASCTRRRASPQKPRCGHTHTRVCARGYLTRTQHVLPQQPELNVSVRGKGFRVWFFFFFPDSTANTNTSLGQHQPPLIQDDIYLPIDTWNNQT